MQIPCVDWSQFPSSQLPSRIRPLWSKGAPQNAEEICMNAIVFAAIWGIGGQIEEFTRPKFDKFI
jgi:hypothetical protein